MPKYEARPCENAEDENKKWCVYDGNGILKHGPCTEKEAKEVAAKLEADAKVRNEHLCAKILSTAPGAKFEIPAFNSHKTYTGRVAATTDLVDGVGFGFAQDIGKETFVLHLSKAPEHHENTSIKVKYQNGKAIVTILDHPQGRGLAD